MVPELNDNLKRVAADIEKQVAPYLKQRHTQYLAVEAMTGTIKVTDETSRKLAEHWLQYLTREEQGLDLVRKAGPGALGSLSRKLHALFKPSADALVNARATLKTEYGRYILAQRRAADINFKAAAASHAVGQHAVATAQLVAASKTDTETSAGTSTRGVWKVAAIDQDQLPRAYLTADTKKIFEHARDTPEDQEPTPIAGVKFSLETITTVRSSGTGY